MPQFDSEFDLAEARGKSMLAEQPRAVAARYIAKSGKVVVDLANGCSYTFPTALVEDLNGADAGSLSEIVVDGSGFNLHWPQLDADLYVPALVAGLFGTQQWMKSQLAAIAGSSKSAAKAAAARSNGAKGGRPRKAA